MTRTGANVTRLVLAALLWGSSATFIKYALGTWQPMTLLTVQLIGANVMLWAALLIRGYQRPPRLGRLAVLGILEPGLCYALIIFGLQRTSAANTAVLSGLESCFVVILAAVFLGERLRHRSVTGLLLAIAGIFTLEGARPHPSVSSGDLLVLTGILSAAVYVVIARTTADSIDSLTMTAHQFAYGLAVVMPFLVIELASGQEQLPWHHSVASWLVAVCIGVLGYAASFLLYNHAIGNLTASRAGIILNLIPIFGVAAAVTILGERLTPWQILGACLIVISIFTFPGEPADRDAIDASGHEQSAGADR